MNISILMLIGTLLSLNVAVYLTNASALSTNASANASKSSISTVSNKTSKKSKSLEVAHDSRGKRTIIDLGSEDFSLTDFADRRQGYVNEAKAYYPQDNYYNEHYSTFNQNGSPNHLPIPEIEGTYSNYQSYLEPPEPIIEIIIKDSNETVPTVSPKPIVTKKKKEKVQVFYVKYKKDENNKLHLESPIASLNNDDNEEPEEEEIFHYPTIVTPLPPVKTTTLRTIIHPDSEKYHSNSGIHVSFGSEDKFQKGHILEEKNAESVQRHVVAIPVTQRQANVRADYSISNSRSHSNFQYSQSPHQLLPMKTAPKSVFNLNEQQLPETHIFQVFRPNAEQFYQKHQLQTNPTYQHQQQQFAQPPFSSQFSTHQQHQELPSKPLAPKPQQTQFNTYQNQQRQQQSYTNQQYNQHFAKSPAQQVSQHQNAASFSSFHKQPTIFATYPPKSQDPPPAPYSTVKFRTTTGPAATKPIPIPVKLENSHYHHPHVHQQKKQLLSHNVQEFGPPLSYQVPPASQNKYQSIAFNPHHPKDDSTHKQQHTQQPQYKEQMFYKNLSNAQFQYANSKYQPQIPSQSVNNVGFSTLRNYFDVKPFKETELLRAIPKYEHHITETINFQYPSKQQNTGAVYQNYPYSNQNQAIHDIPSPKLGPTAIPERKSPNAGLANSSDVGSQYLSNQSKQQFSNYVTSTEHNFSKIQTKTVPFSQKPLYGHSNDGQQIQIVTPMPSSIYSPGDSNNGKYYTSPFTVLGAKPQIIPNSEPLKLDLQNAQQPKNPSGSFSKHQESPHFGVSTLHSDVFRELEQRKGSFQQEQKHTTNHHNEHLIRPLQSHNNFHTDHLQTSSAAGLLPHSASTTTPVSIKASQTSLQLPDEVPDELRQQLLSSGILNNADISVLDYDKVGDVALENLPAEHLQHFYGAGGVAQISESHKVLTVVKPNGESVNVSKEHVEKEKYTKNLPYQQNIDVKVVRFNANNEKSVTDKFIKTPSTVVPPVDLGDHQYNRYLPLKINGAQFPIPDVEELREKKIGSVVVLAAVDTTQSVAEEIAAANGDRRAEREAIADSKEVKFLGGEAIRQLVKKPSKENFKRWLEEEARSGVEMQSVVLLVVRSPKAEEQEIFMYDITTGSVNKLNGELSTAFVKVAEENASSEDLEHASTLDPSVLETMMNRKNKSYLKEV